MEKIVVLLSSYNGEKYIEAQIDSIISQENVDVRLLVRDDGSHDKTSAILRKYQQKYPETIRIEYGVNLGCVASFYKLLSVALLDYSDSNYFAFADQDDVWNKDKLAAAVARLKQYDAHSPNLYGCPFVPVNEQLVPLPYRQGVYYNTMGEACVINMMLGCTMVFNRSAVELFLQAKTTDIPCLHDEWLYKACLAVGGNVCYDSEPHILYRQHGNNVVGFKLGFLVRWRQRWHNFNASYKQRSTTLNHIWQVYQSNITAENQKIIKPLINPGTFAFRMKLVFSTVYQTHSKMNDILFRISYLCNRF